VEGKQEEKERKTCANKESNKETSKPTEEERKYTNKDTEIAK
jgi:hypothetical protein